MLGGGMGGVGKRESLKGRWKKKMVDGKGLNVKH